MWGKEIKKGMKKKGSIAVNKKKKGNKKERGV